jgi:hypothetical protein
MLPVIFTGAVPVLLRVKRSAELLAAAGWLGNVKLEGERVAIGAPPVPVKLTVSGLLVALSVKLNVAARLPEVAGVNVTVTVQLAFPASEPAHVLLAMAKSPGLVPVICGLLRVKDEESPLVKVTL